MQTEPKTELKSELQLSAAPHNHSPVNPGDGGTNATNPKIEAGGVNVITNHDRIDENINGNINKQISNSDSADSLKSANPTNITPHLEQKLDQLKAIFTQASEC
jgi:hypothetical protein